MNMRTQNLLAGHPGIPQETVDGLEIAVRLYHLREPSRGISLHLLPQPHQAFLEPAVVERRCVLCLHTALIRERSKSYAPQKCLILRLPYSRTGSAGPTQPAA